MEKIRFFSCSVPNCNATTAFDVNMINKPLSNKIICSKCGKEWAATITASCCFLTIKFVSIEIGSRRPLVSMQSFPKG